MTDCGLCAAAGYRSCVCPRWKDDRPRYGGILAQNLVQARQAREAVNPQCDLYFYPMKLGSPCLRVKKSADEPGYLFQCLDQAMDIQVETYHVNLSDALQQVTLRMRVEDEPKYRVEAL